MSETARKNSWLRILVAFAAMFAMYQGSEGMQTVFAPGNPLGPALMILALLVAWPLGRWLGWRGYDAFGLELVRGWLPMVLAGLLLAGLAKLAALALAPAIGAGVLTATGAALTPSLVVVGIVTTFIPSVAEDILTRGFLLRTIPVRLGAIAYVLLSAVLYTANHIWRFDWE